MYIAISASTRRTLYPKQHISFRIAIFMLKKGYTRPLLGSHKPQVEKFDTTSLSKAELSNQLDSFAQINSDPDRLEADEKIVNEKVVNEEIINVDRWITCEM